MKYAQLLACLLLTSLAQADWTATGQFNYTDRLYDLSGFTTTLVRPVREADVQVYDLTTQAVIASGTTDFQGSFSITVVDAQTRNVGVRVLSSNVGIPSLNFSVVDDKNSDAVYTYHDAATDQTDHLPTAAVDFGTMTMPAAIGDPTTTDWSSQVFNVYDMGLLVADWILSADGARPSVFYTMLWNPTNLRTGSFYSSGSNRLSLADDDAYDDPNILHEIGHYIEDEFGRSRNTGGSHTIGDDDQDPRLAFSEGFATFVSAAALRHGGRDRPDLYQDRGSFIAGSGGGFSYAYEAGTVGGSTNEQAVTAALYDLIDDANTADDSVGTDDDTLSGLQASVWSVVEQMRIINPLTTQMEDFWDIWFSLNLGNEEGMAAVFASHNIDFAPDAQEPNNTPATSTPLSVGTAFLRNSFYRNGTVAGGDEDWFRFNATADSYYVIEINGAANSIFGRPDPELWLIDPTLTQVLAYNDDPYDSVLNTQSSSSAQDMAETVPSILWRAPVSGTYYIYTRHASQERNLLGRYGTYNIRVRTLAVPTPTIISVSEQIMLPGQSYQALVVGSNFSRSASVTTSAPNVTVGAVQWLAPTALVVTLTPAAGVPDGTYSLSVTNPSGTAGTLASAFEVSSSAQPPVMITEVNLSSGLVEVLNMGSVPATLTGWSIRGLVPSTTSQNFTFPTFTLAAGATVVVSEAFGTNTATNLFVTTSAFNWPWANGLPGDVSLLDNAGRNVDFLRVVTSPHSTHAAPQGTGGAWMSPQLQSPAAGFTISRAESTALFRTPFGLAVSAPTMPPTATGRTNNTDPWENNDQPRRCQLFGPVSLLNGVRISSRPSGTDSDWFGFIVEAGDEVSFLAAFTHASGNLDMELYAPGEETTPLLTANSTNNNETLTLTSAQSTTSGGGIYRLRVFGVSSAVNTYTLSTGPTVSIAATDATASETNAANTGLYTLTRTGNLAAPLTVQLALSGTATNGIDYVPLTTAVTIPALASTAPISLTAQADSLAEGLETATLTISPDPAYSVALASSSTVTIEDQPIDAWRYFHFGGNPPLSADLDDADGDGLNNLLEYALGTNPTQLSPTDHPTLSTEVVLGTTYVTLTYQKNLANTDITYQPESSATLSAWLDLSDTLVSTVGNIQTRKARIPTNGLQQFLRLKITRP
jgi:hypothetical protein